MYNIGFRTVAKDNAGKLPLGVGENSIGDIIFPVTKDDKVWTTTTLNCH